MSFLRVETRRDEQIFFVIFVRYFSVFSETRKNENHKKTRFFVIFSQKNAIFRKKRNFFAKIRVGTSIRESRRVRKKLEKLAPTLIFVKRRLPKLAKTKISAKAVFRRALV